MDIQYYCWRPRPNGWDRPGEFTRIVGDELYFFNLSSNSVIWRLNTLPKKDYLSFPVHRVPDVLILMLRGKLT